MSSRKMRAFKRYVIYCFTEDEVKLFEEGRKRYGTIKRAVLTGLKKLLEESEG